MTADDDLAGAADAHPHPDAVAFIRANMRIAPVPSIPEIRLYAPHPASGLRRLSESSQSLDVDDDTIEAGDEPEPQPPYWAYAWAGGAVLARYILDQPQTVTGRRVLDLGAGSGLVGIAAAKSGARSVIAAEIDRNGVAALGLNAAANGVALTVIARDITAGMPPEVDIVTAGDVFYARDVADRVMPFLDRCLAAGIEVLIGDPGRAYLPYQRLRLLAEYTVPDFGETKDTARKPSGVFSLEPNL